MGWVIAGAGLFAICGAAFDWEWFMNNRKAQFFVRLLGRPGTRIFYGVLGAGLAVLGGLMVAGIVQESQGRRSRRAWFSMAKQTDGRFAFTPDAKAFGPWNSVADEGHSKDGGRLG